MTIWILHALVIAAAGLATLLVGKRPLLRWIGAAELVIGAVLFLLYAEFLRLPWEHPAAYLSFISFAGWIGPAVVVQRKPQTMAVTLGLWGSFVLLTGHAGWLVLR